MKTVVVSVVATLAAIVLLVWLGAAFGGFQIAANEPESRPVARTLGYIMENSVKARARGVETRPIDDAAMVAEGAHHYRAMCAQCHGGPGHEPDELARGLNPQAPDLTKTAGHWSDAELFWITRNGIRRTAMPAWSATDSDDELWQVVAFVRKLPGMTADTYARLTAGSGEHEHEEHQGHEHGEARGSDSGREEPAPDRSEGADPSRQPEPAPATFHRDPERILRAAVEVGTDSLPLPAAGGGR